MTKLNEELFEPFVAFKSLEEKELKSGLKESISRFIRSLLTNPVYLTSFMLFPLSTFRSTLVSFVNMVRFSSNKDERSLKEVLRKYGYSVRKEKYGYKFSKKTVTGEEVGEFRVYKLPEGWTIVDGKGSLDYLKELVEIASNNGFIYWEKVFEEAYRWLEANKALNKREYENLVKEWEKGEIERLAKLGPEEALEALNSYQEPFKKELIRELANKKEFREAFKRAGIRVIRKRDVLKYFLICLGAYEFLDLFCGFPGLIDLGETVYLAANLNPSEAKPWEWDWNQALNLALRTNDLNTVSGIFNGNSDIVKFVELYKRAINVIPNDIKIYYSKGELNSIGYKLIDSIYADGKFSKEEADVLKKLFSNEWKKRWWIVRDMINSGMVNEKCFNEDWDKDGLTNLNEIMQGTNPLNELETDPRNWSERYAILLHAGGDPACARQNISIYHLLKKNGYSDKNIIIFFHLSERLRDVFYDKDRWKNPLYDWLKGDPLNDYPVELDYTGENITIENYLKTLATLPSDSNDIVFIWHAGSKGWRFYYPEEKSLHINVQMPYLVQMNYGRLIIVDDRCSAENTFKYIEDYHLKRFNIKELLGIGSYSIGEGGGGQFTELFFPALEKGMSIGEAFKYAYNIRSKPWISPVTGKLMKGVHPVIYYFNDSEKKECPWLYFNFLKYIRRK